MQSLSGRDRGKCLLCLLDCLPEDAPGGIWLATRRLPPLVANFLAPIDPTGRGRLSPFTFHDLRAKSGSDAEDVQEANDRLAHDDLRTTEVVYRRKPRRARPGRKVGT